MTSFLSVLARCATLVLLGLVISCGSNENFVPDGVPSSELTAGAIQKLSLDQYRAALIVYSKCQRLAHYAEYSKEEEMYERLRLWLAIARFADVNFANLYTCEDTEGNTAKKMSADEHHKCADMWESVGEQLTPSDEYVNKYVRPTVNEYFDALSQQLKYSDDDRKELSQKQFAKVCH